DPFKQIAWKATARTGKLMVRDLDRETMVTHWLLVDVGGTMRDGRPGQARLDLAVDVAAAYARGALEAGDRVALVTFDGRIVGERQRGAATPWPAAWHRAAVAALARGGAARARAGRGARARGGGARQSAHPGALGSAGARGRSDAGDARHPAGAAARPPSDLRG